MKLKCETWQNQIWKESLWLQPRQSAKEAQRRNKSPQGGRTDVSSDDEAEIKLGAEVQVNVGSDLYEWQRRLKVDSPTAVLLCAQSTPGFLPYEEKSFWPKVTLPEDAVSGNSATAPSSYIPNSH